MTAPEKIKKHYDEILHLVKYPLQKALMYTNETEIDRIIQAIRSEMDKLQAVLGEIDATHSEYEDLKEEIFDIFY